MIVDRFGTGGVLYMVYCPRVLWFKRTYRVVRFLKVVPDLATAILERALFLWNLSPLFVRSLTFGLLHWKLLWPS